MSDYGLILLAAGGSSRLGEAKQLLPFRGHSLVRQMAETALEVVDTVVVVTGAEAQKVEAELSDLKITIARNEEWKEGIASSIHEGITNLLKIAPSIDGILFMVCDQPFVSASLLKELISKKQESKRLIIASAYGNSLGTPALFKKEFIPELLKLKGDSGAKKIIMENVNSVLAVPFALGTVDVDTREDYQSLLEEES